MASDNAKQALRLADVLGNRRVAAALTLGFASGLPFALSQGTLQGWLAELGLNIKTIGWFTLVGLPYNLKFLWAPLLDRYVPPFLGRRRGWIVLMQALVAIVIAVMGLQAPNDAIYAVAILALLLAFLSASQDVVIDAYRTDSLRPEERGIGSTAVQIGWRVAFYISGALAMVLSGVIGWRATYLTMAAIMGASTLLTLFAPEPEVKVVAPRSLQEAVFEPIREFFGRPGILALLSLVILYKIGDAAALSLSTAFLIKGVGFTAAQVGAVAKTTSITATIIGTVLGGLAFARLGLYRSLLIFGVLQAATNLLYSLLAVRGHDLSAMVLAVGVDNLAGAMAATIFGAFIMALCDHRFSAFQFALLSALSALSRTFVGPIAAVLVAQVGWPLFFVITFVAGAPGLFLLWRLRARIETLDLVH
ncbi:MAG: MFS transporter [Pseudomonadota bacterium]|jgi:PAT family beta-lactamase induction signal transducer AmpG